MLWGLGFGGEIQLKITHSLCLAINLCIKPGLNTPFKVMVYVSLGGGTEAKICPSSSTDSKWRPVPLKGDSF